MNTDHDLVGIDLNLLVAFDALASTGSVTRAAERMHVTQSAMSHTLRRLRELFDDPLLVRTGASMSLTPRAEALAVPIRAALTQLGHALREPGGFDPARSQRTFRVTAPVLFDLVRLPRIWRVLAREAPGVRLVAAPPPVDTAAALASGELDLAVVPVQPELAADSHLRGEILRRTLFRDRMCAWVRGGHPLAAGMDLDAYLAASHILVSPTGRGPGVVDHVLAQQDRSRDVVVRVPHFATALALVHATDLVLTAPTGVGETHAPPCRVELPIEVPEHGVAIAWHRRFSADPGHVWLRELFARA